MKNSLTYLWFQLASHAVMKVMIWHLIYEKDLARFRYMWLLARKRTTNLRKIGNSLKTCFLETNFLKTKKFLRKDLSVLDNAFMKKIKSCSNELRRYRRS